MTQSSDERELRDLSRSQRPSFVAELGEFLLHNKKWWLAPIVVMMLLLGLLVVIAGSGAGPFIYTLF